MMIQMLLAMSAAIALPQDFREDPDRYWRLEELSSVPAARACPRPECAYPGMEALLLSGKGPNGTEAEFFAYYARPMGKAPEGGYPAVLLTHGGGGTAFPNDVERWCRAGFAVLATDWNNQMPAPGLTNVPPSEVTVPRLDLPGGKRNDIRANVANLVLAHSYLLARPEVNPSKTVYVGLSWGSWYGSTIAAVDGRFKGVVNIYCGDAKPDWKDSLVNGRFLHAAKCPVWWICGTNDDDMAPETGQAAFEECPRHFGHALVPRLWHSHVGFQYESVMRMAKHFAVGEPTLPILGETKVTDRVLSARVLKPGKSTGRAVLNYTLDRMFKKSADRKWLDVPATFADGVVSAEVPEGAVMAFLSLYESDEGLYSDLCGSSAFMHMQ